jgi:protein-tyrosine phosphatase
MAEVLNWESTQPEEVSAHALRVLAAGGLVAFPTETVYGIAADPMQPAALERLALCKGRPEEKPFTLAVPSAPAAKEWLPGLGKIGWRLARRCWPGPLTLVASVPATSGPLARLPVESHRCIAPHGTLGVRVPAHGAILDLLDRLSAPLALTSANPSGQPDALTGSQVVESLGDAVDLIIDAGPTSLGMPSTVVQVEGESWKVLRQGVLTEEQLRGLTGCVVLFVCTGNTCRSPMAAGLCKKLLAERLGCAANELEMQGFRVLSAGVSAMMGGTASPGAVAAARQLGVDLEEHVSRPLTMPLLLQADYIFALTRSHQRAIEYFFGEEDAMVVELLSPEGLDVVDPYGGEQAVYDECASELLRCLQARVAAIEP